MSKPTSPAPAVPENQALHQIRGWIDGGRLRPGNRLPSERDLAEQLQVTRFVIRAALTKLERQGLIRCASKRIRVVAEPPAARSSLMAEVVVLLTTLQPQPLPAEEDTARMVQLLYYGVAEGIQKAGLSSLTIPPERLDAERVRQLVEQRVRGCIALEDVFATPAGLAAVTALHAAGIAVAATADVLSDRELRTLPCDRVTSNHRTGAYALTRWLIQRGKRRIQRYWRMNSASPATTHWRDQRDAGYLAACADAGVAPLPVIEPPRLPADQPDLAQRSRLAAGFLLEAISGPEPIDAIMAVSDGVVFEAAAACRLLGRDPLRDVAVVGYDNYWAGCDERRWEPTIPAATIDKRHREIGHELVRLLGQRIAGGLGREPQVRMVPPKLIILRPNDE